jgi:hypothetical protein
MTALARTPVRRIVRAIGDAAARWADADFPPRVQLLDRIVERTGYTTPVVEYALDTLFSSLATDAIEAVIAGELGSTAALDAFTPRAGRPDAQARPVGSVCIISSRTTIGVAIVPAVFALAAKCDVLVKDREDALVSAFFATLAQELDAFAEAARARAWESEHDAVDLAGFDAVVAFGNDATLERIASGLTARTRFIPFGARASIGYVTREALADEAAAARIARDAARDLVLYETEGCLSLHALFIEEGGAIGPATFAALLARAVERAAVEFPPGRRDARAAAQLAAARNLAAFRAAAGTGRVFSDAQASFLAVLDPPRSDPPPFLPRAIALHAVDTPGDALAYVREHAIPLEAAALAEPREDALAAMLAAGAHRIAAFGELQRPPLGGNHGGRPRIAEFVTWTTRDV